jgi:hypothetical protein
MHCVSYRYAQFSFGVGFGEDGLTQRAGRQTALGGLFNDKNNFVHVSISWLRLRLLRAELTTVEHNRICIEAASFKVYCFGVPRPHATHACLALRGQQFITDKVQPDDFERLVLINVALYSLLHSHTQLGGDVPNSVTGSRLTFPNCLCDSERMMLTLPRNTLALRLTFGSTHTWCRDLHPTGFVTCTAHTFKLRVATWLYRAASPGAQGNA